MELSTQQRRQIESGKYPLTKTLSRVSFPDEPISCACEALYSKNPHKKPPYVGAGWLRFLNYGHLTGHFAQTVGRGRGNVIKLSSKSLVVAVEYIKGHSCFRNLFLLKMGCEISGWRFLKCWFFYTGFYCICVVIRA